MAILPILKFPEKVLARKCREIKEIDDNLCKLAEDMADTMYDAPGVGLAAPQVGEDVRMIVFDCAPEEERGDCQVLINPVIVERQGEVVFEEACLSVPDYMANVTRSSYVKVHGIDLDGQEIEVEAEGLEAVCLQHEIDHLDGVLFIDHLSSLKRNMYAKKRKKQLKQEGQA